jgi:hypothetical protein
VALKAHAHEIDNVGAQFMAACLNLGVAADSRVTVYMHIMACGMGDLVSEWGGLMKWCTK